MNRMISAFSLLIVLSCLFPASAYCQATVLWTELKPSEGSTHSPGQIECKASAIVWNPGPNPIEVAVNLKTSEYNWALGTALTFVVVPPASGKTVTFTRNLAHVVGDKTVYAKVVERRAGAGPLPIITHVILSSEENDFEVSD